MTIRVAIFFDNLGPYHIARLKAVAGLFDLLAIECRRTSKEYAWRSVDNVSFNRVTLSDSTEGCLRTELSRFQPAVIAVPGWSSGFSIAAIRWALNAGVRVIMMSESQEIDFRRVIWKEAAKQRIVALCDAALVGGAPHREYMVNLGMPRERVSVGYDVVDNEYFWINSERVRADAAKWRANLGLPERYFLCSARFITKKNLLCLISAYRTFLDSCATIAPWSLVILGDGEQRAELEAAIAEAGLCGQVYLPGFRQIDELPAFYALANSFILPSTTEQWGLVVNEAMASGLPVLVSERCGCASDLVENGRNGFTIDPYDVDGIAGLMAQMASPDCDLTAMGKASLEIIDRWSPETFAAGLEAAVQVALQGEKRAASFLDRVLLRALSPR